MQVLTYGKDQLPSFNHPIVAIGAFDGFHLGHKKLIEKLLDSSKEVQGDSLIVTFDPHPRLILDEQDQQFKLLTTLDEKISLLAESGVDYLIVIPFSYSFALMPPQEYVENFLMLHFKPIKIIAGNDHRFGRDGQGDGMLLRQYAQAGYFQFEEVDHLGANGTSISSTRIRQLLSEHRVEEANALLGHNYSFQGTIIPGNRIGREIGYRTANLSIEDPHKLMPPHGIYAAICKVGGQAYDAMLYIGTNESLVSSPILSIEVHILDFNQDIYGLELGVSLVDYIRPDLKFQSKQDLIKQIAQDEKHTRRSLLRHKLRSHPQGKNPSVAIAILNYNGLSLLEKFLKGILEHKPKDCPLYVIDNGSTDTSLIYIEHHYPEVHIIRLRKNYGFALGYNKGIAQINADYLVLLNSDVLVNMNWIPPVLSAMQTDPLIFAAQPKILSLNEKWKFEYAGAAGGFIDLLRYPFCRGRIIDYIEEDHGQYNEMTEVFWATGAAMVVKTVVFKALGGFDADFFAHQEEIDLCWRMKRIGGKIISTSDSVVYHLGGGTLDYDNPRKTYLNFRNNLFAIFKNETWYNLLFILPSRLVLDIFIAISYLLKGKLMVTYKIFQAYVVGIINTLYLIHKKNHTNQLVEELRVQTYSKKGILNSSIFLQFYIAGNKVFSKIPKQYFK